MLSFKRMKVECDVYQQQFSVDNKNATEKIN